MDTMQTSTPDPILPQSKAFSPAESPNRPWLLWLIGGLIILMIGVALGIFTAKFLNQYQSQPQLTSTPTPVQSPTPTSTVDPTANWKTYTNSKYNFVFKHPNLDEKCCGVAGAVSDNPTEVITLADITTTHWGTDASFDGLSVYIVSNENNMALDQYIEQEKIALFKQFKVMADPNATHKGQVIRTKVADQPAVSLVDYSWDGITRTYFKHPNSKIIIEISKGEQSLNHFSSYSTRKTNSSPLVV